MTQEPESRPADMQAISNADAWLYEAVVTLEHGGQRPDAESVAAATGLPADEVRPGLESLVEAGFLSAGGDRDHRSYEPADRGWSATPDQAEGHHLG